MSQKRSLIAVLFLACALLGAGSAVAKEQFVYTVKFVCGYNPTNLGTYVTPDGITQTGGEPPVKFGNYATEINIIWPELYVEGTAFVFKHLMLLVERGVPVGREPNVVSSKMYADRVELKQFHGTMDDCNRIAELAWGNVPIPYPLTIGYLSLTSTHELSVNAVYTAETCSNWVNSPEKLNCLDSDGKQQGVSVSIDVENVVGKRLIIP